MKIAVDVKIDSKLHQMLREAVAIAQEIIDIIAETRPESKFIPLIRGDIEMVEYAIENDDFRKIVTSFMDNTTNAKAHDYLGFEENMDERLPLLLDKLSRLAVDVTEHIENSVIVALINSK